MEPEGSLPRSQVPATCPYPEPAWSSPYPHILLVEDPSICWVLRMWKYIQPQVFNNKSIFLPEPE
jgi:hypothetical protein